MSVRMVALPKNTSLFKFPTKICLTPKTFKTVEVTIPHIFLGRIFYCVSPPTPCIQHSNLVLPYNFWIAFDTPIPPAPTPSL